MFLRLALVLIVYTIGSFPTALVYSLLAHRTDIRTLGDGNMGARNTVHQFGFSAGVLVALADILKGACGVLLMRVAGLPLEWQLLGGAAVILGHDFPVFARFRGGQGFAATTGVFLALFPFYTLIGFIVYCFLYLLFKNSDIGAGVGMALIMLLAWLNHAPGITLAFMLAALLFVPFKQWIDRARRQSLRVAAEELPARKNSPLK